jgi:hypothetical protein
MYTVTHDRVFTLTNEFVSQEQHIYEESPSTIAYVTKYSEVCMTLIHQILQSKFIDVRRRR